MNFMRTVTSLVVALAAAASMNFANAQQQCFTDSFGNVRCVNPSYGSYYTPQYRQSYAPNRVIYGGQQVVRGGAGLAPSYVTPVFAPPTVVPAANPAINVTSPAVSFDSPSVQQPAVVIDSALTPELPEKAPDDVVDVKTEVAADANSTETITSSVDGGQVVTYRVPETTTQYKTVRTEVKVPVTKTVMETVQVPKQVTTYRTEIREKLVPVQVQTYRQVQTYVPPVQTVRTIRYVEPVPTVQYMAAQNVIYSDYCQDCPPPNAQRFATYSTAFNGCVGCDCGCNDIGGGGIGGGVPGDWGPVETFRTRRVRNGAPMTPVRTVVNAVANRFADRRQRRIARRQCIRRCRGR